jgi:hypothetical protein
MPLFLRLRQHISGSIQGRRCALMSVAPSCHPRFYYRQVASSPLTRLPPLSLSLSRPRGSAKSVSPNSTLTSPNARYPQLLPLSSIPRRLLLPFVAPRPTYLWSNMPMLWRVALSHPRMGFRDVAWCDARPTSCRLLGGTVPLG